MVNPNEFRPGNILMQKLDHRIKTVVCGLQHFGLMEKAVNDFFPLVLKSEILEKCGFVENKNYPLLPTAREFKLVLPVNGNQKNEIHAYIKSNGECFAKAMIDDKPASNPVYHLHQVQNLFYAITGRELEVGLK